MYLAWKEGANKTTQLHKYNSLTQLWNKMEQGINVKDILRLSEPIKQFTCKTNLFHPNKLLRNNLLKKTHCLCIETLLAGVSWERYKNIKTRQEAGGLALLLDITQWVT